MIKVIQSSSTDSVPQRISVIGVPPQTVPVPLQLLLILGSPLLPVLLGHWFKLQLMSSQPLTATTTPRNLDNLSTGWVIQAKTVITLNNQSFPAQSFFQVIEKKANSTAVDNPEVLLRFCQKSSTATKTPQLFPVKFSELQDLNISILPSDQPSPCE